MLNRISWLGLTSLLVAALVLVSCQRSDITAETGGGETTMREVVQRDSLMVEQDPRVKADSEELMLSEVKEQLPQYGGTITMTLGHANALEYWDPVISKIGGWLYSINYEYLIEADWSRGPSGTGENPMNSFYVSDVFMGPGLAESWEIRDLRTTIYHLREGVRWQDKPPMNNREFTVDDVLFSINRAMGDARNSWVWDDDMKNNWVATQEAEHPDKISAWLQEQKDNGVLQDCPNSYRTSYYAYKINKYTMGFRTYDESISAWRAFNAFPIMPREAVELYGDLDDYRHQVSTGPWMAVDCVTGNSVTWVKNPDYWRTDPFYPDNRLPYADRLIGLIIPDSATYLAALRTHMIDRGTVAFDQKDAIRKSNPELLYRRGAPNGSYVIFMRTDIAPFSDIRVRQALCLGVDQISIAKYLFQDDVFLVTWPLLPFAAEYTPYEQLPEDIQELYTQNVDKAKRLLTEAGYPDGFKTTLGSYTSDTAIALNNLVVQNLDTIGVEVEYTYYEGSIHNSMLYNHDYSGMHFNWWGNLNPITVPGWSHGGNPDSIFNFSKVKDPIAEEFFERYYRTLDPAERTRMLKEEAIREMGLVWEIPLPITGDYLFWVPWLKGHSGEFGTGGGAECGIGTIWKYMWVDQFVK